MKKRAVFILLVLVIGAAGLVYYETGVKRKIGFGIKKEYSLGLVEVLQKQGIIRFPGKVVKNSGDVLFLAYVNGYRWMEKESAIVSPARIQDLQYAIALLNWKDWDDLWNRKKTQQAAKYKMFLVWKKGDAQFEKQASQLLAKEGKDLYLWDLVFLGSPYFDEYLLDDSSYADCSSCPLFSIEKKTILSAIEESPGQTGYKIDSVAMPEVGTEVAIEIRKQ